MGATLVYDLIRGVSLYKSRGRVVLLRGVIRPADGEHRLKPPWENYLNAHPSDI